MSFPFFPSLCEKKKDLIFPKSAKLKSQAYKPETNLNKPETNLRFVSGLLRFVSGLLRFVSGLLRFVSQAQKTEFLKNKHIYFVFYGSNKKGKLISY